MRIVRSLVLGLLCLVLSAALAQQSLSIATGGTGGVYYPYGGALAELIDRHIDGYSAAVEVTGASVENVGLVVTGESDLALALADTVYQAYTGTGTGPLEGRTFTELRALLSIYPNIVHIVTLQGSGIESLQDLRGRRVSVGAPGSGTEVSANTILEANGITYDDFTVERLSVVETAAGLRDGQIDAGFWSGGLPTGAILDLAFTRNLALVPLTEEEIANAIEADPTFLPFTVSEGVYQGVDEEVPALSTPNLIIVHEDMDEELAYNIVRVIYENVDFLIERHPAAEDTTVEFAMEATLIPLHPGALRYFEEIGAEIPERLRGD